LVRVMVEARLEEQANDVAARLAELVASELGQVGA
jgi:phosphomannomutase